MQSVSSSPLIATFKLSTASLNLGRSQNSVLGNGLSPFITENGLSFFKGECPLPLTLALLMTSQAFVDSVDQRSVCTFCAV